MAVLTRNGATLARHVDETFIPVRQVIGQLFQDGFLASLDGARSASGTNLWETAEGYVVQVGLPGMKPDSIACTVEQDMLTITAEPAIQAPDQARALRQSFGGPAAYQIQLPTEVEAGTAEAAYEAGVLTLRLPKAPHVRPQTIKVVAK